MPSAQDCAERLREQAYRTLVPQVRDLEQELKSISSSLLAGLEQIERKLEALRKIELPTAELVLNEILENEIRQKDKEANALVLFMRGLHQKETQEEILSFLLDGIHQFYPRVALLSVRGGRLIGWSSRGFAEEAARNISSCAFSCSENPQFEAALESEEQTAAPEFAEDGPLQFLREDETRPWNLLPLKAMQRPAALLLIGGTSDRSDAASIMIGLAAFRLENVALKILHELSTEQVQAAPRPVVKETAASGSFAGPQPAIAAEEPVSSSQILPAEPEPGFVQESANLQSTGVEPSREPVAGSDVLAIKGADLSPVAEAEAPTEVPSPALMPEAMIAQQAEPQPVPGEEKLHADAKRFARLLVSEIKLYNEHHVVEGRGNRDLYLRLKRDIDKSREMYEKRVSPIVSRRIDYFHDEIVRILGDNDPSTLGSDYPGPRVES